MNDNFLPGKSPKKENQQTFTNSRYIRIQCKEKSTYMETRKIKLNKTPYIIKITVRDWLITTVEAHIVESKFQN